MNTIRHTTLMLSLAAALALPTFVRAAEGAPEAPAATSEQTSTPAPMAGMGAGMGMGPGMRMGPGMGPGGMRGDNCHMGKGGMMMGKGGGMMGGDKPCMMDHRPGCRMGMGGGDSMTEKRLEMLEKRMDMMQMMMKMMMNQSADDGE